MALLRKTATLQWALIACVLALYLSSAAARPLDDFNVADLDAFEDAWDLDPLEVAGNLKTRSLLATYNTPPLPPKAKGNVVVPGNGPGGVGGGNGGGAGGGVGGGSTGNNGKGKGP